MNNNDALAAKQIYHKHYMKNLGNERGNIQDNCIIPAMIEFASLKSPLNIGCALSGDVDARDLIIGVDLKTNLVDVTNSLIDKLQPEFDKLKYHYDYADARELLTNYKEAFQSSAPLDKVGPDWEKIRGYLYDKLKGYSGNEYWIETICEKLQHYFLDKAEPLKEDEGKFWNKIEVQYWRDIIRKELIADYDKEISELKAQIKSQDENKAVEILESIDADIAVITEDVAPGLFKEVLDKLRERIKKHIVSLQSPNINKDK